MNLVYESRHVFKWGCIYINVHLKEPTLPKLISNNFRSSAMIHSIMPKFDEKVKQYKMDPLLNCKNMLKELHIEYEFSQSMSLIPKKKCY